MLFLYVIITGERLSVTVQAKGGRWVKDVYFAK